MDTGNFVNMKGSGKMKQIVLNGIDTGVILQRYPPVLPLRKDIKKFEEELGYSLPQDYFDFLLNYNGGTCKFGSLLEDLQAGLADLYCFYTADEYGCMPLRLPIDCLEDLAGLKNNMLPIGEMDSGDLVALWFHNTEPEVVVISHEDDSMEVIYTAPSFTQFLSDMLFEGS